MPAAVTVLPASGYHQAPPRQETPMAELVRVTLSRRALLAATGAAASILPRRAARAATLTPPQTEGPFYPTELPADADSDLVRVTGAATQAVGLGQGVPGRLCGSRRP